MFPDSIPAEYRNTLVQMDALVFLRSLPNASVPLYLFSPPYNLGVSSGGGFLDAKNRTHYAADTPLGRRGGAGKWDGGALANGYDMHDDAMPWLEYVAWQQAVLRECWRGLAPNGAIYYNHKPRVQSGILQTPLDFNPGLPIRQIVIWARAGGINFNPTHYCPTHEWVVIFAKPDFRLKSKGASGAGDTWYIPQEVDTWHPAPFPLALAQRVIDTTMPAFVADPFCGSGTTSVAAKQCGIDFIGCDLSADYVVRANERVAKTRRNDASAGIAAAGGRARGLAVSVCCRFVASPALARRGDYILASQIEDEPAAIRASLNGRALGGPTDVLLWRDASGQWREFRPAEYWLVRTR